MPFAAAAKDQSADLRELQIQQLLEQCSYSLEPAQNNLSQA